MRRCAHRRSDASAFHILANLVYFPIFSQVLCVHDEGGPVVVKVYFKRGDLPQKEILAHKARGWRPFVVLLCTVLQYVQLFGPGPQPAYATASRETQGLSLSSPRLHALHLDSALCACALLKGRLLGVSTAHSFGRPGSMPCCTVALKVCV